MYEGSNVILQMRRYVSGSDLSKKETYHGKTILYDQEAEKLCIHIQVENLLELSLDAVYECIIITKEEQFSCDGMIKERYKNEQGNIIDFLIDNGFYKINIK